MAEYNLLEYEINNLLSQEIRESGLFILQRLRLHPCEMDIVIFDPKTLLLTTLEIKRMNWKAVLQQSLRAKLYCHYSVAVLPLRMYPNIDEDEFSNNGIGLFFYEECENSLSLTKHTFPQISDMINRQFKQQVYRQFYNYYGVEMYAGKN